MGWNLLGPSPEEKIGVHAGGGGNLYFKEHVTSTHFAKETESQELLKAER